jgi:hypothetical protein
MKSALESLIEELEAGAWGPQQPAEGEPPCKISPPTPVDHPAESLPGLPPCGAPHCGGCYSVGEINGRERFIHPPKASAEWEAWLRKWPPKGKVQ